MKKRQKTNSRNVPSSDLSLLDSHEVSCSTEITFQKSLKLHISVEERNKGRRRVNKQLDGYQKRRWIRRKKEGLSKSVVLREL